jgi:hypothetical protein
MNHTLFRQMTAGGAIAAAVLAGSLVTAPANAAESTDPLTVVQGQGLLGDPASGPVGAPSTATTQSRVEVKTASEIGVSPVVPGSVERDATTGANVYRRADFGTVTGTGAEGTNASFIVINNASAPSDYRFTIGSTTDTLTLVDGGKVQVKNADGDVVNYLTTPWAHDANGKQLPTSYTVDPGSNIVTQHVDTTGAAFPVTADPSTGCGVGWCSVYFNRAETKAIAAGGPAGTAALTAGCALVGTPVVGGVCALVSGAITAFAQGADANKNCLGIVGYGLPGTPLSGWNPFVLDKGASQCK